MIEIIDIKELNLDYEVDNKTKYVSPDKRVLVYQKSTEIPKRFRMPSAVYFTLQDLLAKYKLENHLDNILYIFNESIINMSMFRQRINAFKSNKSYNSFSEFDELAYYYAVFLQENAELLQITIKSNIKGKKHDITLKSKVVLKEILSLIQVKYKNKNKAVEHYEQKKEVSDNFNQSKYYDFILFTTCKYFYSYFKKNCKTLKKYTIYFYVGQIFVVLDLLDTEIVFNKKNNIKYNYTSYYKYLTDNIHNCLNRMPDFYKK